MNKIIKQTAFSFGWKPLKTKPIKPTKDGYYSPRFWQNDCTEILKNSQYSIINAPMGSGKTWEMCNLSTIKMKQDDKLRTIIAVPQTIIGNGFSEVKLLLPDKSKLHWFAQHNLCDEYPNEGTIQYVIDWLSRPQVFLQDKILICTHSTIVAVYNRLKEQKDLKLLHDLNCWIDEAHHLKNAEVEGFEDAVISNGIGELVSYLFRYGKNVHIGLATASFFRGDRLGLLTPKMEEKFVRFDLPYDEYLETMQYLKSFSFDFILCGPDYHKAIDKILKQRKGKDIIYIPHPISRHSTGNKYDEVEKIITHYQKRHKGKEIDLDNGLTILKNRSGDFKIVDLVDEDKRKDKKNYICSIDKSDDLDAIIALGMFKEGANWIWADRSIIVGPRSSLVDVIQMIGRLFRDAPGKGHVEVIQLLPFSLDQTNEDKFRETLNNYLKAIYASLILENILHPVQIKLPGGKKKNGQSTQKMDWLGLELPDDAKQLSLIEDVSNKLMEIADTNEEAKNIDVLYKEYKKSILSILKDYGIKQNMDEVGDYIWGIYKRRTLQLQGIDVSSVDFDILKTNPSEYLIKYTSGSCGIKTLNKLRTALSMLKTPEEWVPIAENLAKNNNDKIPNYRTLINTGFGGLAQAIRCHPELFDHLSQENFRKRPKHYIALAQQLASKNNGIVPFYKWLYKHGYIRLWECIIKYPDEFSSLNIQTRLFLPNKYIKLAEKLVERFGSIPNAKWLKSNNYSAFYSFFVRHPEYFTHFKREMIQRKITIEEVNLEFKKHGCQLLAKKYINNSTPMSYICECGNKAKICYNNFFNGNRCKQCGNKKQAKQRKLNYKYVKEYLKNKGCNLLETYEGYYKPLKFICSCGKISITTFARFRRTPHCIHCNKLKRLSIEEIRHLFKQNRCLLLEDKYYNSHTLMRYICSCGNYSTTSWDRFKRGHRCRECGIKKSIKSRF